MVILYARSNTVIFTTTVRYTVVLSSGQWLPNNDIIISIVFLHYYAGDADGQRSVYENYFLQSEKLVFFSNPKRYAFRLFKCYYSPDPIIQLLNTKNRPEPVTVETALRHV